MKKFKCPKCGRTAETLGSEVTCPPLVRHPKGWGAHLKDEVMVLTSASTTKQED